MFLLISIISHFIKNFCAIWHFFHHRKKFVSKSRSTLLRNNWFFVDTGYGNSVFCTRTSVERVQKVIGSLCLLPRLSSRPRKRAPTILFFFFQDNARANPRRDFFLRANNRGEKTSQLTRYDYTRVRENTR